MPKRNERPLGIEDFRALLREGDGGSDDADEQSRSGWRQRRHVKKQRRQEQRAELRERIRADRRREPVTVGGAALIVATILVVGAVATWAPWDSTDGDPSTSASASPSPSPEGDEDEESNRLSPEPSSARVDLSEPDAVAEQWASHYLTRSPPSDQTHEAPVDRAAPWASDALTENLTENPDPEWGKLVSRGGVSTVESVRVRAAGGDLPPDTPGRVWRKITAKLSVESYRDYEESRTLHAEIMRSGGEWRVTRVLGL